MRSRNMCRITVLGKRDAVILLEQNDIILIFKFRSKLLILQSQLLIRNYISSV